MLELPGQPALIQLVLSDFCCIFERLEINIHQWEEENGRPVSTVTNYKIVNMNPKTNREEGADGNTHSTK